MSTSIRARLGAGLLVLAVLAFSVPAMAQLEEKLRELDAAIGQLYAGGTVTMDQCIQVALIGSSAVLTAEEDHESSGVDVSAAWSQWLPNLTANMQWQRNERTDFDSPIFDQLGPTGEVEDALSIFTSTSGSLSSNWTVFSGFSRLLGLSRAKADQAAAGLTLEYQKELVEEQVGNAYLDYIRAILKVQVAEDAEELAEKELEKSETYFELGISTRSDVLQQKVQLQRNRLESVQARNEKRNTFASLTHLMGIAGAREFQVDTDAMSSQEMMVPDLAPVMDHALANRADYLASEYNVTARSKAVGEARAGYYPSVQIFGQISRSRSESPQSLRLGAEENQNISWGIQGQWAIFDRFSTQQQTRRAVANRRKAEYAHRQALLDLEKEIIQLRNNLIESAESFAVATQAVEQADEELRLAQERFRVGAGTSLDVINAQVGLAQARRDVVDAQTNYAKFRNQLDRASGGALR